MHAHTAGNTGNPWLQMPRPAATDEILSGYTDLCSITKRLTEVVLARAEETMRLMEKIYWCAHALNT